MFATFAEKIRCLSLDGPTEAELQDFLREHDLKFRVVYAPFDWINTAAKVVIVGITPGEASMRSAFRAAATALRNGETLEEASKCGRRAGSFSNMRHGIARMLDGIGLHGALGIRQSEDLFGTRYDLLHPTACIRYPVFIWRKKKQRWENYTGHSPKLVKWDVALRYVESQLADELCRIPSALVVPCGEAVDAALRHLVARGLLEHNRCLFGFPHASGLNTRQYAFFAERKESLKQIVADWQRRYQAN